VDAEQRTVGATERDETARAAWRDRVGALDPQRFVFVDQCGTHTSLRPLYARAPRGERAHGRVPRNRARATTLVASLTLAGMGPAITLEGGLETPVFETSIEQVLAPTLEPGQSVVLDNLGAHQSARVSRAVAARGAQLWFLPASSPDLSPIEEAFSKLKALLRRAEARTRAALDAALTELLGHLTAQDASGWFPHCGYLTPAHLREDRYQLTSARRRVR
jgi:transposase